MKRWMVLILVFVCADALACPSIEGVRSYVNDLRIFVANKKKENPQLPEEVLAAATKDAYVGVSMEVANLCPEDFNILLTESLEKFAHDPSDRAFLFQLWDSTRKLMVNRFAAQEFNFWDTTFVNGIAIYGTMIAMVRSPIRWFLNRAAPRLVAEGQLLNRLTITNTWRSVAIAYGSGVGLAYLEAFVESLKSHAIDPAPNFYVLQTYLACELAHAGEESSDVSKLHEMKDQLDLLGKQNSDLANIKVGEKRLKSIMTKAQRDTVDAVPQSINCNQISVKDSARIISDKIEVLEPEKSKNPAETEEKPIPPPETNPG